MNLSDLSWANPVGLGMWLVGAGVFFWGLGRFLRSIRMNGGK